MPLFWSDIKWDLVTDVVVALIANVPEKKVLMQQRRSTDLRPLMWEMPGGKLQSGESRADAVRREIKEEIDCDAEVEGSLLDVSIVPYEKGYLRLSLMRCHIRGTPVPNAAMCLQYLDPTYAIMHLSCTPSTYLFYPCVLRVLGIQHGKMG